MVADGVQRRLHSANTGALEADSQRFFARLPADSGPPVLVGALPFDRAAPSALWQPQQFQSGRGRGPFASALLATEPDGWPPQCSPLSIAEAPDAAGYAAIVRQALRLIDAGRLEKVVLARSLVIRAAQPVDPLTLARRLALDSHATIFCARLPVSAPVPASVSVPAPAGSGPVALVGATPELLVKRQGRAVVSHPLAGSAARSRDPARDRQAAERLLQSGKDRHEHALVVEAILDQLSPHCADLGTPDGTTLHSTATMWHLGTRISGRLLPGAPSAAGLAALLHPTPAVGGVPRHAAIQAIADLEPHRRGFYAGAIGFVDAQGDGEWHVTLRCAEICGRQLTLHAGAGIVAGSDPEAEVAETAAKFRAILRALELDEPARMAEMAL